MLEKKPKDMSQLEMISIEEFVPKDHMLRKINKAVTAEEVKMNIAYRWFCSYLFNGQTPHFSTLGRKYIFFDKY